MTLTPERRRNWLEAWHSGGEAAAIAREIERYLPIDEIRARLRDRSVPRPSDDERRKAFVAQETERFRADPAEGIAELGALVLDRLANEAAFDADAWERAGLTARDLRLCAAFAAEGMDGEPGSDNPEAIARDWAARPHELGDWLAEEGNARGLSAYGLLTAIRNGKKFYGSVDLNALFDRAQTPGSTRKEGSA